MVHKRFIFLDVDGVLNHQDWYDYVMSNFKSEVKDWPMNKFHMCPNTVQLLNQLQGAEVIISSSWMYTPETVDGLHNAGLKLPIIGGTIHNSLEDLSLCRGNDIAKWLVDNGYKYYEDRNFIDDGWAHTHKSWSGSFKDLIDGTGTKTIHDDDIAYTYVIIDDDDDILYCQKDHYIQTSRVHGLVQADINKAKKILNIE